MTLFLMSPVRIFQNVNKSDSRKMAEKRNYFKKINKNNKLTDKTEKY